VPLCLNSTVPFSAETIILFGKDSHCSNPRLSHRAAVAAVNALDMLFGWVYLNGIVLPALYIRLYRGYHA
jgi:hypothetical protein